MTAARSPLRSPTSTTYERRSLDLSVNLSDAHSRQPLTASQVALVDRLGALFHESRLRSQFELEEEFVDSFLELAGQRRAYDHHRHLLSYSASTAITMAASLCRRRGWRVALVEPAFDNIPSILRREQVPLVPVSEADLRGGRIGRTLGELQCDVVWLVLPNNPTGWHLSRPEFVELVDHCAATGRALVTDFCFRFFCPGMATWQQYETLRESGVTFLSIEDTGKTWSTLEIKLGMVVCSDDLYPDVYRLHDDLLQHVSPFHLRLLTEFIRDTGRNGLGATVRHFIDQNRRILRRTFGGGVLSFVTGADAPVSVDWLRIEAPFTGEELWTALVERAIYVLPGSNFFWSHPERGRRHVRIPLARDPELVAGAAPVIAEVAAALARRGVVEGG